MQGQIGLQPILLLLRLHAVRAVVGELVHCSRRHERTRMSSQTHVAAWSKEEEAGAAVACYYPIGRPV